MIKKSLLIAIFTSVIVCGVAFAAKRTDCPADNRLALEQGKECCCQNVADEPSSYYECNPTTACDTSEGSGKIKLSGPPFCPCMFTKPSN